MNQRKSFIRSAIGSNFGRISSSVISPRRISSSEPSAISSSVVNSKPICPTYSAYGRALTKKHNIMVNRDYSRPTLSAPRISLTTKHDIDDDEFIITRRFINNRSTGKRDSKRDLRNESISDPGNNLNSVTIVETYGDTYYSNVKNLAIMKSIRNKGINEKEWKTCKSKLCNCKICPDSDSDYCARCKCDHNNCKKKGSHGVGGMFTMDMKKNEMILLKRFCNRNNINDTTIDDFRLLQDMNIKYKYCKEHLFAGYIYAQCIRNTSLVKWRMQTDGITVNGRDVDGKIAMGSTDDPKRNVTISRCDGSAKYWLVNGNKYSEDEIQEANKRNMLVEIANSAKRVTIVSGAGNDNINNQQVNSNDNLKIICLSGYASDTGAVNNSASDRIRAYANANRNVKDDQIVGLNVSNNEIINNTRRNVPSPVIRRIDIKNEQLSARQDSALYQAQTQKNGNNNNKYFYQKNKNENTKSKTANKNTQDIVCGVKCHGMVLRSQTRECETNNKATQNMNAFDLGNIICNTQTVDSNDNKLSEKEGSVGSSIVDSSDETEQGKDNNVEDWTTLMDESDVRDGTRTPSYFASDSEEMNIESMKYDLKLSQNESLNLSLGVAGDYKMNENNNPTDARSNDDSEQVNTDLNGNSMVEDSLIKCITATAKDKNKDEKNAKNIVISSDEANSNDHNLLFTMEAALIEKDREMNEMNSSVLSLNNDILKYKTSVQKQSDLLREKDKLIDRLQQEKSELLAKYEKCVEALETKESEYKTASAKIDQLNDSLQECKHEIETMGDEIRNQKQIIDQGKEVEKNLEIRYKKVLQREAMLQERLNDVKNSEKQMNILHQQITDIKTKYDKAKHKIVKKKQEVEEVKLELEKERKQKKKEFKIVKQWQKAMKSKELELKQKICKLEKHNAMLNGKIFENERVITKMQENLNGKIMTKNNNMEKMGNMNDEDIRGKDPINTEQHEIIVDKMLREMKLENDSFINEKNDNKENKDSIQNNDSANRSVFSPVQSLSADFMDDNNQADEFTNNDVLSDNVLSDNVLSDSDKHVLDRRNSGKIREDERNEKNVNKLCTENRIPIVFGTNLPIDWSVEQMKRRIIRMSKGSLTAADIWVDSTRSTVRSGVDKKIFYITPKNGKNVAVHKLLKNIFDTDKYNKVFRISWIEWNERSKESKGNQKLKDLLRWRNDVIKKDIQEKMKNRGY